MTGFNHENERSEEGRLPTKDELSDLTARSYRGPRNEVLATLAHVEALYAGFPDLEYTAILNLYFRITSPEHIEPTPRTYLLDGMHQPTGDENTFPDSHRIRSLIEECAGQSAIVVEELCRIDNIDDEAVRLEKLIELYFRVSDSKHTDIVDRYAPSQPETRVPFDWARFATAKEKIVKSLDDNTACLQILDEEAVFNARRLPRAFRVATFLFTGAYALWLCEKAIYLNEPGSSFAHEIAKVGVFAWLSSVGWRSSLED